MSSPELSVVCRSCGEEVSPYVTECPYCGTRLRKRAPKLELRGDELTPRQSRRARRRMARAQRAERLNERPYAVIAAIAIPAVLLLVRVASPALDTFDLGGIVGPVGGDWWRYLAAPFGLQRSPRVPPGGNFLRARTLTFRARVASAPRRPW